MINVDDVVDVKTLATTKTIEEEEEEKYVYPTARPHKAQTINGRQ